MRREVRGLALLVSLLVAWAALPASAAAEEPADAPAGAAAAEPDAADPWEPVNRPIFAFNDFLARYALEPVGRAWAFVLPSFVRDSVARLYTNVRTPGVMVNDLLQGKPRDAGVDLARFILNTSIGLAGLLDPAAAIGLAPNQEDFGQTFGVWGIPAGPYFVLPFLGPSSPRDAAGRAVDSATVPVGFFVPIWITASITTLDLTNSTSLVAKDIAEERAAAFDWYAAVRNAYVSRRASLVRDGADAPSAETPEPADEDLYFPGEEPQE